MNPNVGFKSPANWLYGRLDYVSSVGQGTFGFVDDGYRTMRHTSSVEEIGLNFFRTDW